MAPPCPKIGTLLSPFIRLVKLSRSALLGQGTFGMVEKKKENEAYVELDIRDASKIIRKLSEHSGGFVDLLHVNCEGCEWEMLDNIINNNLLPSIRLNSLTHYSTNTSIEFRIVQIGTHYFPEVEDITSRYCNIKKHLKKTHIMVYGQSWGWERWDLKSS